MGHLHASEGRPSVLPEQLLSALLLHVLYGIHSERQLIEQSDAFRMFDEHPADPRAGPAPGPRWLVEQAQWRQAMSLDVPGSPEWIAERRTRLIWIPKLWPRHEHEAWLRARAGKGPDGRENLAFSWKERTSRSTLVSN